MDGRFSYGKVIAVSSLNKISLNLYPNPTKDVMTLQVNGTIIVPTKIILCDAVGHIVKRQTLTTESETIDVRNLGKGLYHIQLIEKNNVVATYPFVVQ